MKTFASEQSVPWHLHVKIRRGHLYAAGLSVENELFTFNREAEASHADTWVHCVRFIGQPLHVDRHKSVSAAAHRSTHASNLASVRLAFFSQFSNTLCSIATPWLGLWISVRLRGIRYHWRCSQQKDKKA